MKQKYALQMQSDVNSLLKVNLSLVTLTVY